LEPNNVSALLGCVPTRARRKGEPIGTGTHPSKTGSWHLEATDRSPEDLDGQISELLGKLTQSLDIWNMLSAKYRIDLFCGFFMQETNEGIEISVQSLTALSSRGISLGVCIYSPTLEALESRRDA
jgi:hypothetical protein